MDTKEQPDGHTKGPWGAASPTYRIGERVHYLDQQSRQQTGEVYRIEASWDSYMNGRPLIVYTVSHPSYRNNRIHVAESGILGWAYATGAS